MVARHVPSLDHSQLKLILVSVRLRVVASMTASKDQGEC